MARGTETYVVERPDGPDIKITAASMRVTDTGALLLHDAEATETYVAAFASESWTSACRENHVKD